MKLNSRVFSPQVSVISNLKTGIWLLIEDFYNDNTDGHVNENGENFPRFSPLGE